MIKNIDRWVEKKVEQYVERDVERWMDYQKQLFLATQESIDPEQFESFCASLEDEEMVYRAQQESYWREELIILAVNSGMAKLSTI